MKIPTKTSNMYRQLSIRKVTLSVNDSLKRFKPNNYEKKTISNKKIVGSNRKAGSLISNYFQICIKAARN